ncbi:D-glycerate dehydrogenase [Clostridium sp.]|jgi:gluconate 2-dehydrogenase|uniref:2-hydroxyacid dehydrogenase n=1 Tax=Clostridium sp. TaxID=1506 RepID=UPI00258B2305|nr:D-glycerate dehydrogenase [Clostridium sp.]MDF2504355.1 lactate dehydrogenase-like oxidoreductase [Clostridium sp.]
MIRPKVYIAKHFPKEVIQYMQEHCDCEEWEGEGEISRETLLSNISDKDGVILTSIKIDKEFLEYAPNLKVVSNMSVGYDNFDLEAMKSRNIIGTNTPGVLDNSVADLIFGLILSSSRRIVECDKYVRQGKWKSQYDENYYGIDVYGKTIGIIGMGRIGEAIAKRAKFGFDMNVFYHNRSRKIEVEKNLGVKYSDLESLLKKSDFVVLMTPFTKETYRLMSVNEFNLMKKTAVFINASRGQTVDEKALIEALKTGEIYAAGLDVYEKEPIEANNELLKLNNVVVLPHLGSATWETRNDMARVSAENMVKALVGEIAPNIVSELKK